MKVTKEKETEISAGTLKEAIDGLVEKYGKPFEEMIFEKSGNVNRYLKFYVKDRALTRHDDMETKLSVDDEIVIIVIIGGG